MNNEINALENQLVELYKNFDEVKTQKLKSPETKLDTKMKEIVSTIKTLQEGVSKTQKKLVDGDQSRITKISQQLSSLTQSVDKFRTQIPTTFKAEDTRSQNIVKQALSKVGDSVVNAFNKKIRGACFMGASLNARDKQLPSKIERETKKQEKLTGNIKEQIAKQHKLVTQMNELITNDPGNTSALKVVVSKLKGCNEKLNGLNDELTAINTTLTKLQKKLDSNKVLDAKGDEMRQNFQALGGERIELTTADKVKLDGLYLDASAFKATLSNAGCKVTTFQVPQEGKDQNRQIQTITMSAKDYAENGKKVMDALDKLKAFSGDPTDPNSNPGAGWTKVNDGGNIMLVRSEELPDPDAQHPLFTFDPGKKTWEVKQDTYASTHRSQPESLEPDPGKKGSGTVILTSGNAGVYEMHKSEALSFLLKNMNVVMFNFRGYGKSEGEPTEKGLKLDMEAAYQFAKQKSEHPDSKILFKALCMSGGPAAYVASKHPETNIFLDQTYSQFKTVIMSETKEQVEESLSSLDKGDRKNAMSKLGGWLKNGLSSIAANVVGFIAPDFNTAKGLSEVKGFKAVHYTHDDDLMDASHVEKLINTVAKNGEMEKLFVISNPGEHGESLLNIDASPLDFNTNDEYNIKVKVVITELDTILDKLIDRYQSLESELEEKIIDLTKTMNELNDAGGDENLNKAQQIQTDLIQLNANYDKELKSLETEINAVEKKKEEWTGKLMEDLNPEDMVQQKTGRNQMDHFLAKANLSDDIIKTNTQLQRSNETVQERHVKNAEAFINRIESLKATYDTFGAMTKAKVIEVSKKDEGYIVKMDDKKEYPLTKEQLATLRQAGKDVEEVRRASSDFKNTYEISDEQDLMHGSLAGLSKMLDTETHKYFITAHQKNDDAQTEFKETLTELAQNLQTDLNSMEDILEDYLDAPGEDTLKDLKEGIQTFGSYKKDLDKCSKTLKEIRKATLDAIESDPNLKAEEKWDQKRGIEDYLDQLGLYVEGRKKDIDNIELKCGMTIKLEKYQESLNVNFDKIESAFQKVLDDAVKTTEDITRNLDRLLTKRNKMDIRFKLDDQFADLDKGIAILERALGDTNNSLKQVRLVMIQNFAEDKNIPPEDLQAIKHYIDNLMDETILTLSTHLTELKNFKDHAYSAREDINSFAKIWEGTAERITKFYDQGVDALTKKRTMITTPPNTPEYQLQVKAYSDELIKAMKSIHENAQIEFDHLSDHLQAFQDNPDSMFDEDVSQEIQMEVMEFINDKEVGLEEVLNTLGEEWERLNPAGDLAAFFK